MTDNPITATVVGFIAPLPQRIIDGVNYATHVTADRLCGAFSKSKQDSDVNIVQSQLKTMLALSVSFVIIYNWYFVMFYREYGERVQMPNFSSDSIKNWSKLFHLAFKYNLSTMSALDNTIMRTIPPVAERMFKPEIIFTILLLTIVGVILTKGEYMMLAFSTYLSGKADENTGSYIGFSVLFGFASMFAPAGPIALMSRAYQYATMGIPTALLFILRIVGSSAITWLTGLFAVAYLIILSFFSILLYSQKGPFQTIADINHYVFAGGKTASCITDIQNATPDPNDDKLSAAAKDGPCNHLDDFGPCNRPTLLKLIMRAAKWVQTRGIRYIFEWVLMIWLIAAAVQYGSGLKDLQLKQIMSGLAGGGAFCILLWVIYRMYNGGKLLWGGETMGLDVSKVAAHAMKQSCTSAEPEESIESGLMSSVSHFGSMFGLPATLFGHKSKTNAPPHLPDLPDIQQYQQNMREYQQNMHEYQQNMQHMQGPQMVQPMVQQGLPQGLPQGLQQGLQQGLPMVQQGLQQGLPMVQQGLQQGPQPGLFSLPQMGLQQGQQMVQPGLRQGPNPGPTTFGQGPTTFGQGPTTFGQGLTTFGQDMFGTAAKQAATNYASTKFGIDGNKMANVLEKATNIRDVRGLGNFLLKDNEVKDFAKHAGSKIEEHKDEIMRNITDTVKNHPTLAKGALMGAMAVGNAGNVAKQAITGHT